MTLYRKIALPLAFLLSWGLAMGQSQSGLSAEDTQRLKAEEYFYWGVLEASLNRKDEALALLRHSYRLDSSNTEATYELGKLQADRQNYTEASRLLDRAYQANPQSRRYMETLAAIYSSREEDFHKAVDILRDWLQHNSHDREAQQWLATLYVRSGEIDKALTTITELQKKHRGDEQAQMTWLGMKVRLYEMKGDKAGLLVELNRASKEYPNNPYVWHVHSVLIDELKPEEAQRVVQEVERRGVLDKEELYKIKIRYYISTQQKDQWLALLQEQLEDPEENPITKAENWHQYLLSEYGDQEGVASDSLSTRYSAILERLIALHPDGPEPRLIYAQFLHYLSKSDKAIQILQPLTRTHPELEEVWNSLLRNSIALEDNDASLTYALQAIEHIRTQENFYIYAGVGYSIQGKRREAIQVLERGLKELAEENIRGKSELLGMLGDIAHEAGDTAQSEAYYDRALELNPDNTSVLNNYAYYLCESGRQLDRAESMASRAVQLAPDDYNALDTYAWICYKTGKMGLALLYQRKAIEKAKEDASGVLYEHLADILLANGEPEPAREALHKSIELYTQSGDTDKKERAQKKLAELPHTPSTTD